MKKRLTYFLNKSENFEEDNKKKNAILLEEIAFNQSSPVHPVSDPGDPLSVTHGQTEILVSNIG